MESLQIRKQNNYLSVVQGNNPRPTQIIMKHSAQKLAESLSHTNNALMVLFTRPVSN